MSKQNKKPGQGVSSQLRFKIFGDQECKCDNCRAKISNLFDVDHIVPKFRNGNNSRENLHGLCGNCHKIKTELDNAISSGDVELIKHIKQKNPNMRLIADLNIAIAIISFKGNEDMKSIVNYDKLVENNMHNFNTYYTPPTPLTMNPYYIVNNSIKNQFVTNIPLNTPVYFTIKHKIDNTVKCNCKTSGCNTKIIKKTGVLPHESEMNFNNFIKLHGLELFEHIKITMSLIESDLKKYTKDFDPEEFIDTMYAKQYKQYKTEPFNDYKKRILSEGPVEHKIHIHIDNLIDILIKILYVDSKNPQYINIKYNTYNNGLFTIYNGRHCMIDLMDTRMREKRIIQLLLQNIYQFRQLEKRLIVVDNKVKIVDVTDIQTKSKILFNYCPSMIDFIDLVLCPYMIKGYVTGRYGEIVRNALSYKDDYFGTWNLMHYPCNKKESESGITEFMCLVLTNKFQCDSFNHLDKKIRDMFNTIVKDTLQPQIDLNLESNKFCNSVRELILTEKWEARFD